MGNFVVSIHDNARNLFKNAIMNIILILPIKSNRLDILDKGSCGGCVSQELYITDSQNCDIKVKQQ
jgi:hypothetical protein